MHVPKSDDYYAIIEALLKESEDVLQRSNETIRKSEETLRAAKATLNLLHEKLRRIA